MENPIKIHDLGGKTHYFWFNTHIMLHFVSRGGELEIPPQRLMYSWELSSDRDPNIGWSLQNLDYLATNSLQKSSRIQEDCTDEDGNYI